ncbi:MAG: cob(I)yrinic acid a,c-diamide adenosyltransferase [Gammaproteobacteria bacterium]|nr:cob(I)yrinic acid a,c-diamide adenosyltransferase [Rhodocyclaceae bacterium]MBU3909307.1 cob(I)yrinic acid a,c-diamide adenosyltransferase [Gammaproteobacteria bacterium]MBU3989702.1 cob(I)yrinic acid a,c-diamide adenosyltransferase [Gammaproteobacteria bacterium]MBU4005533.1 cob(I)yrinic acid a,c-diamide adenosyltransferase [Gammaproteobacteria bacterium]MBU4020914.1 cob(I)yrinic acid a,c-diamide adenosyltransferase [Gammaproteobacteria bacterium]
MEHKERMQRKKAVVDQKVGAANTARGIFLIHTGNGKGKSSAAFGLLARALGHGMTAAVIQFVKSRSDTGEEAFFRRQPGVSWHVMGAGFTWETQDAARDAAAAQAAWAVARQALADPAVDLVVLDEFTYALKYRWLEIDAVLAAIAARPPMQHLVVTGRAAPPELIETADTVTEMALVKHAFQAGVQAMPGIEW